MKNFIRTPLYRPFDTVQVRAPLLPIEFYEALGSVPLSEHLRDPRIRAAVAVASGSLIARLEDENASAAARRSAEEKLLRYLTRASARPTPFGLFAGVALGRWAQTTNLELSRDPPRLCVRPDMDWLLRLVLELEKRPDIRKALRFHANPAAFVHSGRVYLDERVSHGQGVAEPRVSLRATNAVRELLALTAQQTPYETLIRHFTAAGRTREKIEAWIGELLGHTLLISELRPPLTAESPIRHAIAILKPVAAAAETVAALERFDEACRAWPRLNAADCNENLRAVHALAATASPISSDTPIQADMAWPLTGTSISRAVGEEAARALELLLRLAPSSGNYGPLETYRASFIARYGSEREVPLLELLDPNAGLGPPPAYSGEGAWGTGGQGAIARRNQRLFALACEALRELTPIVSLDDKALSDLEIWRPVPEDAAPSLDVYVFAIAASRAAIDAGEFKVAIGPNIGGGAAGRNLARFAHLLGKDAVEALGAMAQESAAAVPGALHAEIVYPPRKFRSANVAIRPPVQRYEIPLGAAPGVARENTISPADLLAGVADGRFYLRSRKRGARVVVTSTHMLNFLHAPVLCRFLADVAGDGRPSLQMFDWGAASQFPYLPRLEAGRIVLVPAQWRIDAALTRDALAAESLDAFTERLALWRARWKVPRHVYLSAGDHRLLFDLDKEIFVRELWGEVRKLKSGGLLTLQEAVPGPDHAWLEGPEGHYIGEFAVSLGLRSIGAGKGTPDDLTHMLARRAKAPAISDAMRLRPPGSDWLYLKLYGGREPEDDILGGALREFLAALPRRERELPFFFLRYSDPEPHLRLRFHGDPKRLQRKLVPRLGDWAEGLVRAGQCRSFAFDTYEREIERYGGPAAMGVAERIFAADTRAVLSLIEATPLREGVDTRVRVAIGSLHRLLRGLGADGLARGWWRQKYAGFRHETSEEYRRIAKDVAATIAGEGLANGVADAFAIYDRLVPSLGSELRELERRGSLTCPLESIAESLMHMHCNRFLGTDRALERRAIGLLLRGYEAQWARGRKSGRVSEISSSA